MGGWWMPWEVEAMKDGEIAVSFINGAIRLEEQRVIGK
jgi:hypothetical protein